MIPSHFPHPRRPALRTLWVADIGSEPYRRVWTLQKALVEARRAGQVPDTLLFTQHETVFTLGRSGARKNLLVADSFLLERGIECVTTDRGGDVTCHLPGQLVGYPVMRVPGGGRRVRDFVRTLEEAILQTLARFGIRGSRSPGRPGVWTAAGKVGFVGLAVKHDIAFHGFALNVSPDLTPFSWIHPCGLRNTEVTSMQALLPSPPPGIEAVIRAFTESFCALLGLAWRRVSSGEIRSRLPVSDREANPS